MTNYKIKIYSRNRESFYHFLKLLKKQNEINNFKILFHISKKKKTKQKITVLKSPHVNKKAQKQFQLITYKSEIKYLSWEIKKNLLQLKKIKDHLFPDIKIKIESNFFSNKKLKINKLFDPTNTIYYNVKTFSFKQKFKKQSLFFNNASKNKKLLNKTLLNLKVLDHYGSL